MVHTLKTTRLGVLRDSITSCAMASLANWRCSSGHDNKEYKGLRFPCEVLKLAGGLK